MDPLQFTLDPTLTDAIRKGIGVHLEKANADAGGAYAITGEVAAIGDDETGQPRIVVHTTREAIKAYPTSLLFRRVKVTAETAPRAEAESTLSAQGEAVAVVEDWPNDMTRVWIVLTGEMPPVGTKLYAHPAPRVEMDEAMVERLARHLCREEYKDSGMPLDELISACNRYWPRYKDEARSALTAALSPET